MPKQARRSVGRTGIVARAAGAAIAAFAMALSVAGSAAAAEHDRHASVQTVITVKATPGHLVQARHDVVLAGGRVVGGKAITNGFYAQVPVMAVVSLRHAPGIASVVAIGRAIVN
jgi:hypothetical protein